MKKTAVRVMGVLLGVFTFSIMGLAAEPATSDGPTLPKPGKPDPRLPSIVIKEVAQAPVVDGDLKDACWAQAEESRIATTRYSEPIADDITFRICQKDEVIYLGIRWAFAKKGGRVQGVNNAQHDGNMWGGGGPVLEIFIDPDNDETHGYYQLVLTTYDVTYDAYCPERRDPEKNWEPKYQVKSKWSDEAWTIEYGIPLTAFNRTKTIYENFGMNLHPDGDAWSPGHTENFHFPMKFGEVRGLKGANVVSNTPGLFRQQYFRVNDRVIKAQAQPSLIPEKKPALLGKPEIKATDKSAEITFEVNTRTDVAVWVENARGERVCHLVAGLLGANAPAPLKKDALRQTVTWNYLDDFGKKVPAGSYKFKVGVGSQAQLDKEIGRNEGPQQIRGLCVGADGSFFTIGGNLDQWYELMKFDRNGKFLSMLLPPPAEIPPEKLKGLNIIDYGADGQVRFGSHRLAATLPNFDLPIGHSPVINSKGQIILIGCEYPSGVARFYKVNADGSLPDDFIGPYIKEMLWMDWFQGLVKRFHFALDPLDENIIYLSGVKELTSVATFKPVSGTGPEILPGIPENIFNAVYKVRWGEDAGLEVFAGRPNAYGKDHFNGPGEFYDPQGLAFDADNNLWVCDRRNHRIQIFNRQGKYLREFAHAGPYEIRFHKDKKHAYVLGIEGDEISTGHEILQRMGIITKLDISRKPIPKVISRCQLPGSWCYWWTMGLDDSAKPTELKVVMTPFGYETMNAAPHQVFRVRDLGTELTAPELMLGDDIAPKGYYHVAAGWDSDIVYANGHWFDGNSGRYLGPQKTHANEIAATRDGRWVVRDDIATKHISVFPEEWATKPNVAALTNWAFMTATMSCPDERGFCVAPNNDVYIARYYNWLDSNGEGRSGGEGPEHHVGIDHFTIDGKLVKPRIIHELSGGAHSPVVDIHGNVYVCDNFVRKIGQLYEDDIAANLPNWLTVPQISEEDWATLRSGKKVDNGYMKYVFNPLTFAVGTIYKFGPQGGGVSWRAGQAQYMPNLVIHYPETNAQGELTGRYPDWGFPTPPLPKGPATHWSATILNDLDLECGMYPAWLDGVEWEFLGASPAPSFLEKKHNVGFSHLRFCADDFGRLYVPAAHRNTIRLLDTAGNEIMRIGSYGNLDSGPTARLKTPHIPLCFPTATTLSKRYLYIVEARMPRILRVKMGYQQEDGGQVQVK